MEEPGDEGADDVGQVRKRGFRLGPSARLALVLAAGLLLLAGALLPSVQDGVVLRGGEQHPVTLERIEVSLAADPFRLFDRHVDILNEDLRAGTDWRGAGEVSSPLVLHHARVVLDRRLAALQERIRDRGEAGGRIVVTGPVAPPLGPASSDQLSVEDSEIGEARAEAEGLAAVAMMVDDQFAGTASLAFNLVRRMVYGRKAAVELVLAPEGLGPASDHLGEGLEGDVVSHDGVGYSKFMQAQLAGGGDGDFAIDPVGAEVVRIDRNAPFRWDWIVTPLEHGEQILVLRVAAVVPNPNGSGFVRAATTPYRFTLTVEVASWWDAMAIWVERLSPIWFFVAAVGAGLAAGSDRIIGWFRPKRNEPTTVRHVHEIREEAPREAVQDADTAAGDAAGAERPTEPGRAGRVRSSRGQAAAGGGPEGLG